jgi:hypothetical protein
MLWKIWGSTCTSCINSDKYCCAPPVCRMYKPPKDATNCSFQLPLVLTLFTDKNTWFVTTMSSFVCRHCGKVCDSRKGLVQHRWGKRYCFDREMVLLNSNDILGYKTADQYLPLTKISSDHRSGPHQGYYNTQPNVLPVSQSETGKKEINLVVRWTKI